MISPFRPNPRRGQDGVREQRQRDHYLRRILQRYHLSGTLICSQEKLKNSEKYFTISDFEINKSIRINAFSFNILDADEFTKKWMQENLK